MALSEQQLLGEITRLTRKISTLEYALFYVQSYLFHSTPKDRNHINMVSVVDTALGEKFKKPGTQMEQNDDSLSQETT
jgi:hypothetical protein